MEVLVVIKAIRVAWVHRWTHIWLETDSLLVTTNFQSPDWISWRLNNGCLNCINQARQLHIHVSHLL